MQGLDENLEELRIHADTMGGNVRFNCEWLLRFKKLQRLYLGDKAKKNIEVIAKLPLLKHLTLRGIKLQSFDFLKDKDLESLAVLWCGMDDLSSLTGWQSLKSLELWRIMKLKDMSFLSSLIGLEELKLQDLKHVHVLPDLTGLSNLKRIVLNNVPVEESTIPETLRVIIEK